MPRLINLTQGKSTIVDDKDFNKVNQFKWYFGKNGYAAHRMYPKNKIIYLHQFIMNTPKGMLTDHINHNKLDNRRNNLRIVTGSLNSFNKSKQINNTSGIVGITWDKVNKKWKAQIQVLGKGLNLGRYKEKEMAVNARKRAELNYFGEKIYA